MLELKKCPFCGGEAEIRFSGSEYYGERWKGYIVAACTCCRASVRGSYYQGPVIEDLEDTVGAEKVAKAWNNRTGER